VSQRTAKFLIAMLSHHCFCLPALFYNTQFGCSGDGANIGLWAAISLIAHSRQKWKRHSFDTVAFTERRKEVAAGLGHHPVWVLRKSRSRVCQITALQL
jgi:hypothetical protein